MGGRVSSGRWSKSVGGPGPATGAVALSGRRRAMRPAARLAALAALATSPALAQPAENDGPWIGVPLSGSPMINTLVDNYLEGRPLRAPNFLFHFRADGTVLYCDETAAGLTGNWWIDDRQVCVQWPDNLQPTCQQVWLDGGRVIFTDADSRPLAEAWLRPSPPAWAAEFLD